MDKINPRPNQKELINNRDNLITRPILNISKERQKVLFNEMLVPQVYPVPETIFQNARNFFDKVSPEGKSTFLQRITFKSVVATDSIPSSMTGDEFVEILSADNKKFDSFLLSNLTK